MSLWPDDPHEPWATHLAAAIIGLALGMAGALVLF